MNGQTLFSAPLQGSGASSGPSPRPTSPQKDAAERIRHVRPGPAIDLRAEEEAARRLNAGRALALPSGDSKASDLFGRGVLRARLAPFAKEQDIILEDDMLSYIALAAEDRIRSLLADAISAQSHRTTSSHIRAPPMSTAGKPMWSHSATSDPNAVLVALAKANKSATQSFRSATIERNTREAEIQLAKEAAGRVEAHAENDIGGATSAKASGSEGGPPLFGAVTERKPGKRSGKKSKDVSAEAGFKMTNAVAMSSAGMKKYSWMNHLPNQSSPLAPKKRKATDKDKDEKDGVTEISVVRDVKAEAIDGPGQAGRGKGKEASDGPNPRPVKRPKLTRPTRRDVTVRAKDGSEKMVTDDKAVTMMDLLFAMEREKLGKGMGTGDEVVRKAWIRMGFTGR